MNWQDGLLNYQIGGVEFFCNAPATHPHVANFDDMGLGKSAQAIRSADVVGAKTVLVLSPAVARVNWTREFSKFQLIDRSLGIVTTRKADLPDTDVIVCSHDMLAFPEIKQKLLEKWFDVIIVDEAHRFKSREALRTKALYGEHLNGAGAIISTAKRIWLLTGTPMPNNASELYTHLRALSPHRLMTSEGRLTFTQFVNRFCVTQETFFRNKRVTRIVGNKNVAELKKRLEGFYIRRKKEDVLKELPALQWGTVVLTPPPNLAKQLKSFEAKNEFEQIRAVLAAASASHHDNDDALEEKILGKSNLSDFSRLRRLIGLAKVEPTCDLIESELEDNNSKLILFAYHTDVISDLETKLAKFNPVVITGETSKKQRQEAIDKFQDTSEGTPRIFIGQITATNSAITLTASDNVIIMEPSWTPAENVQAAARAHRIGQKSSSVLARYITLAGSLDEALTRVLLRKSRDISEIIL